MEFMEIKHWKDLHADNFDYSTPKVKEQFNSGVWNVGVKLSFAAIERYNVKTEFKP